ncbi:MAG TPA: amidohydrolase [Thermoanaerobaculia bacterium]|nr:amidohydrolase [Thermoanaerobaculia bacterium]
MTSPRRLAAALQGALTLATLGCASPEPTEHATPAGPADLVLRGAAVYTMDAARSWAEAVAIRDGRIVFVGAEADLDPHLAPGTRQVRLDGGMVLPGFHDAHVHPAAGGVELLLCDLNGSTSAEEVAERIRRYAAAHPDREWITGGGFDLPLFEAGSPRRELLDELVPDRPTYLTSSDGHSAWVNSRALEIAGVDAATPDPPAGRIDRDRATGEPSGTLRETAMAMVGRHAPPITAEQMTDGLRRGLEMASRYGITSLVEASASDAIADAYRTLAAAGELPVRAVLSLSWEGVAEQADAIAALAERRERLAAPRLRADAVKLFADGVIEAGTAALLEPYEETEDDRGEATYEDDELRAIVGDLDAAGFQVHIHAIGDAAIRSSLDALEAAARDNPPRLRRHHLAHIQLVAPADQPRFRELGVFANIQPLWAYADPFITELTEPRLGAERSRWLYPFASLRAHGAKLAAGSDWSVSSMNPLEAMQVAVTRQAPGAGGPPVWLPDERLDLPAILAAYTIQGAALMGHERETGSIEVGKAADLVVLDRNLFELAPREIGSAKVRATLLAGGVVWSDREWGGPGAAQR